MINVEAAATERIGEIKISFDNWLSENHPNFLTSGDLNIFLTLLWKSEYETTHKLIWNLSQLRSYDQSYPDLEEYFQVAYFSIGRLFIYSTLQKDRETDYMIDDMTSALRNDVLEMQEKRKKTNWELTSFLEAAYEESFGQMWFETATKASKLCEQYLNIFEKEWEAKIFAKSFEPKPFEYHNLVPDAETKWPKAWGDVDGKFK